MDSKEFQELIERYLSEHSTPGEIEQLKLLLDNPSYISQLEMLMDQQLSDNTISTIDYPEVVKRIKLGIEKDIEHQNNSTRVFPLLIARPWMVAAALIVIVATLGVFWLRNRNVGPINKPALVSSPAPIVAGKNAAILTLSDNTKIVLDSAHNGIVAVQNGSDVVLKGGQLVYNAGNSATALYNTMTTPKGRQFSVVLSDGTKAWLNAASSLRYPTVFAGKERRVEITGEVYFEVAKNKQMPFKVKVSPNMEIEVLGTHFNVNSYSNEPSVNTTLLEGTVQIVNGAETQVLKPGQQARVNSNQKISVIGDVDLKKVMAWKNGVFDFEDASLQDVMRQLERWYDIEVVYEKGIPNIEFVGSLSRDLSLQDVLKGLKLSEVNFRIEGRKLIVMP
ncbi:MAG: FecR family protein [Flavisolibacter sp.]